MQSVVDCGRELSRQKDCVVQKAHVRYIFNDPKLNPRKVRRAKRVKGSRKTEQSLTHGMTHFARECQFIWGDGTTVVHVKQTKNLFLTWIKEIVILALVINMKINIILHEQVV